MEQSQTNAARGCVFGAAGASKFAFLAQALVLALALPPARALALESPYLAGEQLVDHSGERLGDLQLSDFLLEPTFYYSDVATEAQRAGQFQPGYSLVGASWARDATISGKIAVGTKALLGRPARYGSDDPEAIGIVEGYAQAEGYLGRARLGLIPIPLGLEGGSVEAKLSFPRSLFYQKRLAPIRDYGAGYEVGWNGFFSEWEAHNGEAGRGLDNQVWFTSRWGWAPSERFRLGASGMTGRTTPMSTDPMGASLSANAGMDVDKSSRTRIGNAFVDWGGSPIGLAAEIFVGETLQDGNAVEFSAGHADAYWAVSREIALLARWDQFISRSDLLGADWAEQATIGAEYRAPYATSALYLYLSTVAQKNAMANAHAIQVVWRLTPFIGLLR